MLTQDQLRRIRLRPEYAGYVRLSQLATLAFGAFGVGRIIAYAMPTAIPDSIDDILTLLPAAVGFACGFAAMACYLVLTRAIPRQSSIIPDFIQQRQLYTTFMRDLVRPFSWKTRDVRRS